MAAYYLETSALLKRFAKEKGTAFVLNLFRVRFNNSFYAAQLTEAEVFAALAKRRKGKILTTAAVTKAQRRFVRDYEDLFFKIAISNTIIKSAARLAGAYELRGYDTVQLACASAANRNRTLNGLAPLILVSADDELNNAAQVEGLNVENPNNYP